MISHLFESCDFFYYFGIGCFIFYLGIRVGSFENKFCEECGEKL